MITLTTAEARRQFNLSTRVTRARDHHQHWSDWRRVHQATARRRHYSRRLKDHKLLL
jgi:hypothetical protein